MDIHHVLANLSIGFTNDTTAFSALPNAPVLADRATRRERFAAAWRARRTGSMQTPSLHRPVPAMAGGSPRVAPHGADTCRMVS